MRKDKSRQGAKPLEPDRMQLRKHSRKKAGKLLLTRHFLGKDARPQKSRSAASRRLAAHKAVRTKGAAGLRRAARKAASTRKHGGKMANR
jgi:hypothetical protein